MAAFIDGFIRTCGSRVLATIIGINVSVFLVVWILIIAGESIGLEHTVKEWLCVSSAPAVVLTHPWTLLTYMVTQFDFLHLLFNMLWLFWFGIMLHPHAGKNTLLHLYCGGGLAGAILYVIVSLIWPGLATPGAYLCGSSASVLGVMTAVAVLSPNREITLFLFGNVKLKWVTIACIALTFLGVGGGSPGAQSAHVGGVLFGLGYILAVRRGKVNGDAGAGNPRRMAKVSPPRNIKRNVKRDGNAVAMAASGKLSDMSRLDQLLDKIRFSGYSSLTTGERNELNELSRRLDNARHGKQ